jgi:hypothetical protein
MPGLDPGIHRKKCFNRRRWIAGSSPAMTERWGDADGHGSRLLGYFDGMIGRSR